MRNLAAFICLLLTVGLPAAHGAGKSAKKLEADRSNLTPPAVIEPGDNLFGVRTNQGAVWDGATVLGLSYERIVAPNFGIGVEGAYANFDRSFKSPVVSGTVETNAWTGVVFGNFHANVFKVKNLDTYFTGGIAHTWLRGDFKATAGNASLGMDTKDDDTKAIAYLTARYFVDSTFAFSVAVGTGLGNWGLGMDVLF